MTTEVRVYENIEGIKEFKYSLKVEDINEFFKSFFPGIEVIKVNILLKKKEDKRKILNYKLD